MPELSSQTCLKGNKIYQILLTRKRTSERGLTARPEFAHAIHPIALAPFLLTLCNGQNL